MPYATLYLAGSRNSAGKIQELHAKTADILVDTLAATRSIVAVRIVEDNPENWSVAGIPLSDSAQGRNGVLATVSVAEESVNELQIAAAIAALSGMLKECLGANALPAYVVFDLVKEHAWGFRGKTIQQIKLSSRDRA